MTLLEDLARLVREQYVIETDVEAIVDALRREDLPAAAPGGAGPAEVAAVLTTRLQSVNHDRHLRVRHRPEGTLSTAEQAGWHDREAAQARAMSGGIAEVRRLAADTGLLAIAPYTSPVDLIAPYVCAAFTLLRGVDHLVIDLRAGLGGIPESIALICSYLIGGDEPVRLQDIVSRHDGIHQYWTTPTAARLDDSVRVSVLTSNRTFSGCEELAYNLQAFGRARIVGETTGGGAHPVEVFALTDVLEVTVPVAMSVNAVTGTNWEQVGVVPDLPCAAVNALDVARGAAAP